MTRPKEEFGAEKLDALERSFNASNFSAPPYWLLCWGDRLGQASSPP